MYNWCLLWKIIKNIYALGKKSFKASCLCKNVHGGKYMYVHGNNQHFTLLIALGSFCIGWVWYNLQIHSNGTVFVMKCMCGFENLWLVSLFLFLYYYWKWKSTKYVHTLMLLPSLNNFDSATFSFDTILTH